jgi:hypothetical protein
MNSAAVNLKIDAVVGDHTRKALDNSAQLYGILCRSIQDRSLSCLRSLYSDSASLLSFMIIASS